MPNPVNLNNLTPPRVPLTDARTGLISREWYRFFLNLFQLTGKGQNDVSLLEIQYAPAVDTNTVIDTTSRVSQDPNASDLVSQYAELDKLVKGILSTPPPQLGTFAQLQQANLPWTTFDTSPENTPPDVGTVAWDGGTTLGVQATASVLIRVGESEYVYAKASAPITKGQLCYHTGAVGASGVITVAPTPLALADPNQIVGIAAETLANNAFGLIQISGDLRGFNTTGSSVGETWADGDALYYNPAYVGSMTKVKPSAPNQKTYLGEVINAASAGSGSMHIRIVPGTVLGGTDSNVQFGTLANGDLIQYDSTLQYWKNVTAGAVIAGATGAPVTKTANFSVANGETWLINNKSGSTCTVTLPSAATNTGRTLHFQNYQAQLLVSASSNVVPLVGGAATTAILEAVAGDTATLVSDGTNWIMTQYVPNNVLLLE